MSSIGPQLPGQSSKRKRSENEDHPPPNKQPKNNNDDEIDLNGSSDDDDYGPQIPKAATSATRKNIGPSLPPAENQDEIDLDDSDDDYGPSAPPPPPSSGPAPQITSHTPEQEDDAGASSDSDDDYGPSLPQAAGSRSNQGTRQIGPSLPPTEEAPRRDDWMLAPPTATGYSERDPTRIKARKFASGKSASKSAANEGIASIWTETPEEKLQRLQNAVLGRDSKEDGAGGDAKVRSQEEEERNRKISKRLEKQQGQSLYDEHQKHRKNQGVEKEEEDDPSKRAFDREKDMALGGRIGTAQKKEFLEKAKGFGGRFQQGSFL